MEEQKESKLETIKENLSTLETIEQKVNTIWPAEKASDDESTIDVYGNYGNCGAELQVLI